MERLFDQPDLHMIERDLLAELPDDRLRAFWTVVLHEQTPFKTAGDRLGISKSTVMAYTRAGRAAFANYLDRRAEGELCRSRSSDIAARLAGTATTWRIERAEAHQFRVVTRAGGAWPYMPAKSRVVKVRVN